MKSKFYVLSPLTIIVGAVLMMLVGTMVSCQPKQEVEDPATIITGMEIDGSGFMPTGPTRVTGYFDHDSVCESMMMIASQIYTYHYADGHTEVEDHGTFLNYSVDGVGTLYSDSVSYAADSMSLFTVADFTPVSDSLCYTANVVVRLNENGAPIKAIAYVAHNEQWATFNWVRNDQEKPDYWDAPKRFALPQNMRRK